MTADDIRAQRRAEQTVVTAQGKSIIQPIRRIRDAYPSFAAVAVDMTRDEVVFTDENLFQVMVSKGNLGSSNYPMSRAFLYRT